MKCLWYYEWVKLPRNVLPEGRGILGFYAKLASRAAFRKGVTLYCGRRNTVIPGMWSGGIIGIKSILGVKARQQAFDILEELQSLGYIRYTLDVETKKLSYQIIDWVRKCSGAPCMKGTAYTTEGYGFLCLPRNITERLAERNYIFEEADAWMDLWCHTVTEDPNNAFSFLAPAVQYGKYGALLTLETLGQRWGWEKTKVWRFFKKHEDVFRLYRLPSSYGCLILNKRYPTGIGCTIDGLCPAARNNSSADGSLKDSLQSTDVSDGIEVSLPAKEVILDLLEKIREYSAHVPKKGTENEHLSRMVAWYSRKVTGAAAEGADRTGTVQGESAPFTDDVETEGWNDACVDAAEAQVRFFANATEPYRTRGDVDNVESVDNFRCMENGRIALSAPIIYAYLSLCRNWKNYNDCRRVDYNTPSAEEQEKARDPCSDRSGSDEYRKGDRIP